MNKHRNVLLLLVLALIAQVFPSLGVQAGPKPSPVIAGITASVTSIAGGSAALLTVMISAPAPTGGSAIQLHSNRPSILPVPATVTIPAGKTQVEFQAISAISANDVAVTVTARFTGGSRTKRINVLAPRLKRVMAPAAVYHADYVQSVLDISLTSPANLSGMTFQLSSSNPDLVQVPKQWDVHSGQSSLAWIRVGQAKVDTAVFISATMNGVTRRARIVVKQTVTYSRMTVDLPWLLANGATGTGTVTLSPAPGPDDVVRVSSSDPSVLSIDTAQPLSGSSFVYSAHGVGTVNVTLRWNQFKVVRPVQVQEIALVSVNFPRTFVMLGAQTGAIVLNAAAPVGGVLVPLQSSDPNLLAVPESVFVPEGATSQTFEVNPLDYGNVTITASHSGQAIIARVEIAHPVVTFEGLLYSDME